MDENANKNAFKNRPTPPADEDLAVALGAAKPVWDQILADLARDFGAHIHEWKSYSTKQGWALRVKRKSRTIVWLAPWTGEISALFILGERAMQAAREAKLPERMLKILEDSPKYPEGYGIRIQIQGLHDLAVLKQLAALKTAH